MSKYTKLRYSFDVDKFKNLIGNESSPMWDTDNAKESLRNYIEEIANGTTSENEFIICVSNMLGKDSEIIKECAVKITRYTICDGEGYDILFLMEDHEYFNEDMISTECMGWFYGNDDDSYVTDEDFDRRNLKADFT